MHQAVFTGAIALCTSAAIAAPFTVEYDGSIAPNLNSPAFEFIVFGGTSWNTTGGSLNMTTAPSRGIWFGAREVNNHPWLPADNSVGNYVSVDVKMGTNATEWSTYLNDGTHAARFNFDHDGFTYGTAAGFFRVDMDLTRAFHTFEFLLLNGEVSYRVNGQVLANRVAAGELVTDKIVLIGDGTGSTLTGTGSMSVDRATIITAPDFTVIPTPGAIATLGLAGVFASRRRR